MGTHAVPIFFVPAGNVPCRTDGSRSKAYLQSFKSHAVVHNFLATNRDELVARCTAKVTERAGRDATRCQLKNGIPLFLNQLMRTLKLKDIDEAGKGLEISGASGGGGSAVSEMGLAAAAHGREMLALGLSVDQVVHDYCDLCQSITDLAFERDAPFAIDEFAP